MKDRMRWRSSAAYDTSVASPRGTWRRELEVAAITDCLPELQNCRS